MIEEFVYLARQTNLEVDSDDMQELLRSHNQEMSTDELIEKNEQEQDLVLRPKYSVLFVCATKVSLSKQQDEDHERYAAQRYPTHVQSVTYPANTQAKEEAVPAANQDRI
ncbi:hypothetical protein TNCV_709701 [Trichonephila clavipes]|nr:hypothetical protein TNCV_709701 [Trichonephila clavipes]